MKPAIYIETTIVSYIAARPSRQPFLLGCQRLTRRWWREKRREYELFTSQVVADEAMRGEPLMVRRRMSLLREASLLPRTVQCDEFANILCQRLGLPERAAADAVHIALACVHKIDYLLTWNCSHIANPHSERLIKQLCEEHGYEMPALTTPLQMLPVTPDEP